MIHWRQILNELHEEHAYWVMFLEFWVYGWVRTFNFKMRSVGKPNFENLFELRSNISSTLTLNPICWIPWIFADVNWRQYKKTILFFRGHNSSTKFIQKRPIAYFFNMPIFVFPGICSLFSTPILCSSDT